jgi:hypothetical protein
MLKGKIKNKEKTIGMHINLNDVAISRIAGLAAYDFIWIDLEHSYLTLENLMSHILAIQATGTAVIVRVPQDDLTYTKKVIEMGVDGIISTRTNIIKFARQEGLTTVQRFFIVDSHSVDTTVELVQLVLQITQRNINVDPKQSGFSFVVVDCN